MTKSINGQQNLVILVSTFDSYQPCWAPFCHGIQKYWPDCPFPIYFVTNQLDAPCGKSIKVGPDYGWSKNLQFALNQITEDYVIYCQEDYWLKQQVDTSEIIAYSQFLAAGIVDHIRLHPVPPPDHNFYPDARLGIIDRDAEYRVSLQMGLWRKSVLLDAITHSPNGWHFEKHGAKFVAKDDRFLSVKVNHGIDYVFTAVIDGKWSGHAYDYAEQEGIEVDFDKLPQKAVSKRHQIKKFIYRNIKRPLYRFLGRPKFLR